MSKVDLLLTILDTTLDNHLALFTSLKLMEQMSRNSLLAAYSRDISRHLLKCFITFHYKITSESHRYLMCGPFTPVEFNNMVVTMPQVYV